MKYYVGAAIAAAVLACMPVRGETCALPGDVITALVGKRIDPLADLKAAASGAAGSDIKAKINRSGQILAIQIHH